MPRYRIGRSKKRRRSAVRLIGELPNLLKLLVRLMRDPRVSRFNRILFGVVIAYVLMPEDLIPDWLGFMGLVDDLFLIGLALNRLFAQAGPDILLEHWDGNPRALGYLVEGTGDIGSLLPKPIRNTLRGLISWR